MNPALPRLPASPLAIEIAPCFVALAAAVLAVTAPTSAAAEKEPLVGTGREAAPALYLKVDYFKASSERIGEYLQVERNLWKPIHEERLARGIILGWSLYSLFAGEPDAPYNYVAVNVFDDFDKIDYLDLDEIVATVYPEEDLGDFYQRTRASREVVRTEIWKIDAVVGGGGEGAAPLPIGNYLTKNFFDSRDGSGEHLEMETGFWEPIHRLRQARDWLQGWAMATLRYPGGEVSRYTYATMDHYERLGDLTIGAGVEVAAAAYPDLSEEELLAAYDRTRAARRSHKTEIWKLLDSVGYE